MRLKTTMLLVEATMTKAMGMTATVTMRTVVRVRRPRSQKLRRRRSPIGPHPRRQYLGCLVQSQRNASVVVLARSLCPLQPSPLRRPRRPLPPPPPMSSPSSPPIRQCKMLSCR